MTLSVENVKTLMDLGVKKGLIEEVFSESVLQQVDPLLILKLRQAQGLHRIEEAWQLQLLQRTKISPPSDLTWIRTLLAKECKDNSGAGVLHYLAWSGDVHTVLALCVGNALIGTKTVWGETIAHYAAWSGDLDALQELLSKYPAFSNIKDNDGQNIAHHAAFSGSIRTLNWLKRIYPHLLLEKSKNRGTSIVHYAALSGNPEALHWVKENMPFQLTYRDYCGADITHWAMASRSEAQFETAISFTTGYYFRSICGTPHLSTSAIVQFLTTYLKTHKDLICVDFEYHLSSQEDKAIRDALFNNVDAYYKSLRAFLIQCAKGSSQPFTQSICVAKQTLFDEISKLKDLTLIEQKRLWQRCLDPNMELGKRFWKKEGLKECKETKGTLALIGQMIAQIDKELVCKVSPLINSDASFFAREPRRSSLSLVEPDKKVQKRSTFPNLFKAAKAYEEQAPGRYYSNEAL